VQENERSRLWIKEGGKESFVNMREWQRGGEGCLRKGLMGKLWRLCINFEWKMADKEEGAEKEGAFRQDSLGILWLSFAQVKESVSDHVDYCR
jgi:hypothetical protein